MRALAGLLVSLLLAAAPLRGQAPQIRTEVDTTVVTVGDRITLKVSVDHPPTSQVVWPDSLSLAPFEILEAEAPPPDTKGDMARSSLILTLTAFELGDLEIPSFGVEVVDPESGGAVLATNPFGIQVVSVGLDEGADIRDIKGPLGLPRDPVQIFLFVLAMALLAALGWVLYRRLGPRTEGLEDPEPAVPRRLPHEVALEALVRLESSSLLERGQVKEYHIELSDILRTYVEGQFWVPALEMTSRDITAGLERIGVGSSMVGTFESVLSQCDMVKFAKHRPDVEASKTVLALGRRLVEETIPEPALTAETWAPEDQASPERDTREASL